MILQFLRGLVRCTIIPLLQMFGLIIVLPLIGIVMIIQNIYEEGK